MNIIVKSEFIRRFPSMTWNAVGMRRMQYELVLHVSMTVVDAFCSAGGTPHSEDSLMQIIHDVHTNSITAPQYAALRVYLRRELFS